MSEIRFRIAAKTEIKSIPLAKKELFWLWLMEWVE